MTIMPGKTTFFFRAHPVIIPCMQIFAEVFALTDFSIKMFAQENANFGAFFAEFLRVFAEELRDRLCGTHTQTFLEDGFIAKRKKQRERIRI